MLNGRSPARVQGAVEALRAELPAAAVDGISADLGTASGCEALLRQLPEVDVLVNNVGIFEPIPEGLSVERFMGRGADTQVSAANVLPPGLCRRQRPRRRSRCR